MQVIAALLLLAPVSHKADEAAIRKAYDQINTAYASGNLKALIKFFESGYSVTLSTGAVTRRDGMVAALADRFKNQISCTRSEHPNGFKFIGGSATVQVAGDDVFSLRSDGKIVKTGFRTSGIATWTKSKTGWRQAKLVLSSISSRGQDGNWRMAPTRRKHG